MGFLSSIGTGKVVLTKSLELNASCVGITPVLGYVSNFYFYVPPIQKLLIQYLLDAMHCKKNLCKNMIKIALGTKDSYGSRQDMESNGIREELWLWPSRNRRDVFHMPPAPYILKPSEKVRMMDIIRTVRTPSNYIGAIHKCLEEGKLHYMKCHDFHVLMHQVTYYNPY
jgi:hypothetical protein